MSLLVLPARSFDGEYNSGYNYNQQSQTYQPANPGQYRQNRDAGQQYSYAPPQSSFGSRGDNYAPSAGVPAAPTYVAPSAGDDTGRPRKRRRRHHRPTDDSDDTGFGRRKRHHWATRGDSEDDQPRPRGRQRARGVIQGNGSQVFQANGSQVFVGMPGYGSTVACVRTCDGSFFPVGQFLSPNLDAQEGLCKGLCPSTETKLYVIPAAGDGITTAVSRDGHPYSKMRNALLYTKKRVEGCTCHGTSGQARLVSAFKDFTMRRGDAVMTSNGIEVFLGAYRWPYVHADFQMLDKAKYILANGLALAEVQKATKPLQKPSKPADVDDGPDDAADDNGPTFVTGLDGRKVRIVGDVQIYGTTQNSAALDAAPIATTNAAAQVPPRQAEPKKAVEAAPALAGSIVPLWRPVTPVR